MNTTAVAVVSNVKWLSDVLLLSTKYNQTFFDVAAPFLPDEFVVYPLICVHLLGVLLNAVLLSAMLMERQRKCFKIKILLTSLTLAHLLWSCAWFLISLASALVPDKTEDYWSQMERGEEIQLKEIVWELVGRQLVDNLYFTIAIFFMAVTLERYLNLLPSYDPYANNFCCKAMISVLPWLLAYILFDHRLLAFIIPVESAVFCRLCLLMIPTLMSLIFALIACIRPAKKFEYFSSLNSQLPILLFVFSFVNIVMNLAFFFLLLEENFDFVITTGGEYEDRLLTTFMDCWYWIAQCLVHIWAVFFPLCLIIFVKMYRTMANSFVAVEGESVSLLLAPAPFCLLTGDVSLCDGPPESSLVDSLKKKQ